MNYSKSTKYNLLSYRGYYNVTCDKLDDVEKYVSSTLTEYEGFVERKKIFAESKWVYFCINLHNNITTLRKYIPTRIKISFQFDGSSEEFCLLTHDDTTNFIIKLDDPRMTGKRYKPAKLFRDVYENQLKLKRNPTLPIDRSLFKQRNI